MNYQKLYENLKHQIGEENIQIDYLMESTESDSDFSFLMPSKIRITYLPTGKEYFGTDFETQIENTVHALKQLKNDLNQ